MPAGDPCIKISIKSIISDILIGPEHPYNKFLLQVTSLYTWLQSGNEMARCKQAENESLREGEMHNEFE
jgi:hypothetical protein